MCISRWMFRIFSGVNDTRSNIYGDLYLWHPGPFIFSRAEWITIISGVKRHLILSLPYILCSNVPMEIFKCVIEFKCKH